MTTQQLPRAPTRQRRRRQGISRARASTARRPSAAPASHDPLPRHYELDWLRAIIVLGLVPFHAAIIFGATATLGVKSGAPSQTALTIMGALAQFVLLFGMPLLFLVAGASARFALAVRTPGRFVAERLLRLLLPLIFGSFVLIPIQTYFMLQSNPDLAQLYPVPGAALDRRQLGSLPYAYVHFLSAYGYFLRHFTPTDAFIFLQHLWFLPRLLAFTLIALPIFLALRGTRGLHVIRRLADFSEQSGAIVLLGVPLGLSEVILQTGWLTRLTQHWPLYDDWPFFSFGLILFIYGYLLYADERFARAIQKQWIATLLLGFAISAPLVGFVLLGWAPTSTFSLGYVTFTFIQGLGIWSLILGIVGVAMRHLPRTNAVGHYLFEATFALYVLHTLPLMALAYPILLWPIPWPLQLALLIVATLLATLALYELCIRHWNVMRFLFGMKPRGHSPYSRGTQTAERNASRAGR